MQVLLSYHVADVADMDIEEKLKAYRSRKKREEKIETTKKVFTNIAKLQFLRAEQKLNTDLKMPTTEELIINEDNYSSETPVCPKDHKKTQMLNYLLRVNYILYLLLWISLYVIAIELEFGVVFFILSLLFFIWFNTRTEPKKTGEVSAYSVFNPNCEAIDGTLNAEQFESELRYGAISVH